MALTITEGWIRERVQLTHNNLEDVRSLSLPGTYHEKIAGLGTALRNLTRLKHLDLSRNAIDSLQGLESLKMLEKLNLYYNNVAGLQELYRLRQNQKLQEIDLRLNPVARNEPDYRLFLIHMLPNLRRLDDRAVRDSERKAALQHFSTEQAAAFTEHPKPPPVVQEKAPNPRAEHIKNLAKPITVLDDDDVALLELISRSGDLSRPVITGSSATTADIEDYPPDSVRRMNLAGVGLGEPAPTSTFGIDPPLGPHVYDGAQRTNDGDGNPHESQHLPSASPTVESLQQRYPHLPIIVATPPSPSNKDKVPGDNARKNRVQFSDDINLRFQDELEAYTSYKAHGHFTPNPGPSMARSESVQPPGPHHAAPSIPPPRAGTTGPPPHSSQPQPHTQSQSEFSKPGVELYSQAVTTQDKHDEDRLLLELEEFSCLGGQDLSLIYQELPSTHSIAPSSITTVSSVFHHGNTLLSEEGAADRLTALHEPLVNKISVLVDKYWNGAKSLLTNPRFKSQVTTVIQEHLGSSVVTESGRDVGDLEDEVRRLRTENDHLREKAGGASSSSSVPETADPGARADDVKLRTALIRAQRDLSILRNRLQTSIADNKDLQTRMMEMERHMTSHSSLDKSQAVQNDQIRQENDNLRQEIGAMSGQMKQSSQLQELANMLQDSHKSLVQTNEHLLRELEETRSRHDQEVRQLHWSYDQLKQNIGYTPKVGNASTVLNGQST